MFDNFAQRLSNSINKLRGIGRLTEANIKETLLEVRRALLEADVAMSVVKQFIAQIEEKAVGQEVLGSVRPGDALVKLVEEELTQLLGEESSGLNLNAPAPIVILMAGLQGSGKTTTVAKLAKFLKNIEKKSVMLVSTDIYRPAALQQLQVLAEQAEVDFFPSHEKQAPVDIAKKAIAQAKKQLTEVLIIDTAGRLHIDKPMMEEICALSKLAEPTETLLVVDSMTGQDAAHIARTFNEQLELTGIILTKTDGDMRGGAALSMRMITGKPIKFMGVGEKIDDLERFHPARVASRILGMGDIVTLVEQAQHKVDKKQAAKIAKKIKKGKRFDFNDFVAQLQQMKKMGGMKSLLGKLPGMGKIPQAAKSMMDEKWFARMEVIIQSMTKKERRFPALLNGSRKRRIAGGSGTTVQEVNKLLKHFVQLQKFTKRMKGGQAMRQLKQMRGQLPPELLDILPDKF